MTERTTFALDRETRDRLRKLAARWRVSQAEVVRRALQRAEAIEAGQDHPAAALRTYHATGGLPAARAEAYLKQAKKARRLCGV
jgi:hypothetical protein